MKINKVVELFNSWLEIIRSIKSILSLLVLITLCLAVVLILNQDPIVTSLALLLLFLITLFCIIYAVKNESLFPAEIRSIWSENDLPIDESEKEAWIGKWNCRWTYRKKDSQIKPYVDDIIEIKDVDCKSGELTGIGFSSYAKGSKYFLRGRISNKRVAHLFYTSSAETAGLSGMVILSRPPIGEITGWWLGAGRKGGDIGGGVTMEPHKNNLNFKIKNYEVS